MKTETKMKTVMGYVVEQWLTIEQIEKGKQEMREALEKNPDMAEGSKKFAQDYIDAPNVEEWLCHWSRIKYNEAKEKLEQLRKQMPEKKFRVAKAKIVVCEKGYRQSYEVIPW